MDDRYETAYGDDETGGGADFRPVAWQLPETITPGMLVAAENELSALAAQLAPVTKDLAIKWLVTLGTLVTTGANTDAEGKVKALWMVLEDKPAGVFSRAALKRATAKFQWFPSGKELLEFLDIEQARLDGKANRLTSILETGARNGPPRWSKEASDAHAARLREQADAERRELARIIAEREGVANGAANKPGLKSVPAGKDDGKPETANPYKAAYKALRKEPE